MHGHYVMISPRKLRAHHLTSMYKALYTYRKYTGLPPDAPGANDGRDDVMSCRAPKELPVLVRPQPRVLHSLA